MNRKVFPLTSRLMFAPAVLDRVPEQELMEAFARHDTGDWGLVSAEAGKRNDDNLQRGGDLVSMYEAKCGVRFRIVTSGDKPVTRFEAA